MSQTQDERPIFKVRSGTFASGLKLYQEGEEIVWAVPEGWDEKKYGKHFSSGGPSLTFIPVNDAAEKCMEEHKKAVAEKNRPKKTADDERFQKMEAMHIEMMNAMLSLQAENRRLREDSEAKESKKR